jgi:hypothetical protein
VTSSGRASAAKCPAYIRDTSRPPLRACRGDPGDNAIRFGPWDRLGSFRITATVITAPAGITRRVLLLFLISIISLVPFEDPR